MAPLFQCGQTVKIIKATRTRRYKLHFYRERYEVVCVHPVGDGFSYTLRGTKLGIRHLIPESGIVAC